MAYKALNVAERVRVPVCFSSTALNFAGRGRPVTYVIPQRYGESSPPCRLPFENENIYHLPRHLQVFVSGHCSV